MDWILISVVKFLSVFATGAFGYNAIYGAATNVDGKLTRRGRRAAVGVLVSLVLAVVMLLLETYRDRRRDLEAERRRVETSERLNRILTQAQALSDSLSRIGLEQGVISRNAARLLNPLTPFSISGTFVYRMGDAPLASYAASVHDKAMRALRVLPEWPETLHFLGPNVTFGSGRGNEFAVVFGHFRDSKAGSGVDSVKIPFGSTFVPRDSVPGGLEEKWIEVSFTQDSNRRGEGDLDLNVEFPEEETQEDSSTSGLAHGYITLNFVDSTIRQNIREGSTSVGHSSGRITSVLDLAGSIVTVRVGSVTLDTMVAYPVRSTRFQLVLEKGNGRVVRVPDQRFQVMERFHALEEPPGWVSLVPTLGYETDYAFFTYRLSRRDVESHPGEFARFLSVERVSRSPDER